MNQRITGLMVGASGGLVFVLVNGSNLIVRLLAIALFVGIVATVFLHTRKSYLDKAPRGTFYGRGYLLVVLTEVVLLFGGIRVLGALGVPVEANVAWVAFVVGIHFVALSWVWKAPSVALPGAVLTILGIIGFALAATSAASVVPLVSGVLSGFALLAGAFYGALRPR